MSFFPPKIERKDLDYNDLRYSTFLLNSNSKFHSFFRILGTCMEVDKSVVPFLLDPNWRTIFSRHLISWHYVKRKSETFRHFPKGANTSFQTRCLHLKDFHKSRIRSSGSGPGGKIMKNCQGWFQEFLTIKSRPEIVEPSGFDPQIWNFTKFNVKMLVSCGNKH